MTATVLRQWCTIYLSVILYIYPINTLLNMFHKLMYAKFGILGLVSLLGVVLCWYGVVMIAGISVLQALLPEAL